MDYNNILGTDMSNLLTDLDTLSVDEINAVRNSNANYYRLVGATLGVVLTDMYLNKNRNIMDLSIKGLYGVLSELIAMNVAAVLSYRYNTSKSVQTYNDISRAGTFIVSDYLLNVQSLRFRLNNTAGIESVVGALSSYAVQYFWGGNQKPTVDTSNTKIPNFSTTSISTNNLIL